MSVTEAEALEKSLSPAAKVMREVVSRHLDETGGADPKIDPVLAVLERVIDGIKTGTDISGAQQEVAKLVTNQESRSELIDSLMMAHDYNRLLKYAQARDHVETLLLDASRRGDLTPTEALAFMSIITAESKVIQARVKSGATDVKDVIALLEKADYTVTNAQVDLAKKFANTSPQGREIVRRLVHRLGKLNTPDSGGNGTSRADRAEVQE